MIKCHKKKQYEDSNLEDIKKADEVKTMRKALDDKIKAAYDKLKV